MKIKNLFFVVALAQIAQYGLPTFSHSQNVGVNTDGTVPETGVMLDVKGTSPIGTTAPLQNIFQLKSFNSDATALKLRLGLKTDATATLRYGLMEVYDAGAAAYRPLALQPLGGNVGISTTAPGALLDIVLATGVPASGAFRVSRAVGQATYISPVYGGGPFYSYIGIINSAVETNNVTLHTTGNVTFDNGKVGIGVSPPAVKLDVQGTSGTTIKIVDGNQGANKVLTSDATGVGSWQSLSAIGGACFQNSYAFTANGTWTCPAGVTKAFVEVWGAGGGGYQGGGGERMGGGGGGAYAAGYVTVVPSTGYAIVIGAGGATNTAGGASSFSTPLLVAGGGAAGAVYTPGAGGIASSTLAGATLITGGKGDDYDFFFDPTGTLGGDGRWYGKGGNAAGNGGAGAGNNFSGDPPGGGGGAYGTGAAGMVIIRW